MTSQELAEISAYDEITDKESELIDKLFTRLERARAKNASKNILYYQKDKVKDLGISTPVSMQNLSISLGWATDAVNIPLDRINFTSF